MLNDARMDVKIHELLDPTLVLDSCQYHVLATLFLWRRHLLLIA